MMALKQQSGSADSREWCDDKVARSRLRFKHMPRLVSPVRLSLERPRLPHLARQLCSLRPEIVSNISSNQRATEVGNARARVRVGARDSSSYDAVSIAAMRSHLTSLQAQVPWAQAGQVEVSHPGKSSYGASSRPNAVLQIGPSVGSPWITALYRRFLRATPVPICLSSWVQARRRTYEGMRLGVFGNHTLQVGDCIVLAVNPLSIAGSR